MNRSTNGPAGAPPLYVITLTSSTAPMPLNGPSAPELAGLAVFRSRRIEDGRERFRLHLGYFSTAELAEEALPFVRDTYPAAFAGVAPESNLGSLEDTAVARFSVIKTIEAEPSALPSAPPPKPRAVPPVTAAPRPQSRIEPPVKPVPPPSAAEAVAASQPPLAAPPPVPGEPEPDKGTQHYAVQLLWSAEAIDLAKLPALAIFGGYLLYAVETEQGGRQRYGVRLGFYVDALSAGLVAQYVRPHFREAAVVPVSEREHARASSAAIRLSSLRAGSSAGVRTRWPQSAIPVDFVPPRRGKTAAPLRR